MDDILLGTTDTELQVKSGDWAIGDATEQHVQLLFASAPGEWKQHPEVGIGLNRSLGGNITRFMERDIRVQLSADGFDLTYLNITEEGVQVDGGYLSDVP